MLYSQIVLQKGMPFELRLPANKQEKPLALGSITRDELDKELQKGLDSLRSGKSYSADEVDQFFAKEYGAWVQLITSNPVCSKVFNKDKNNAFYERVSKV